MISLGQAPQGVAYVPNAVQGDGMQNLQPFGAAAKSVQLTLAGQDAKPVTQVTLFDQGIVQNDCAVKKASRTQSEGEFWGSKMNGTSIDGAP